MPPSGRTQSGGQGKHTGRSIMRTLQRRNMRPVGYSWERRELVGGDSVLTRGSLAARRQRITGRRSGPTGVGVAAREESTAAKVGKVLRVAEVLPHSEGAAYKRP